MRAVSWSEFIRPICEVVKALAWVLERAAIWLVVIPAMDETASEGRPVVSFSAVKLVVLRAATWAEVRAPACVAFRLEKIAVSRLSSAKGVMARNWAASSVPICVVVKLFSATYSAAT